MKNVKKLTLLAALVASASITQPMLQNIRRVAITSGAMIGKATRVAQKSATSKLAIAQEAIVGINAFFPILFNAASEYYRDSNAFKNLDNEASLLEAFSRLDDSLKERSRTFRDRANNLR